MAPNLETVVRAQAPGFDALDRLPTHSGPALPVSVRALDVFGRAPSGLVLPLNRKTTQSAVVALPLDTPLEPRQESIPVDGLAAYLVKPRRDPPDVAHIVTAGGTARYVIQEGHTRLGAAKLRGDGTLDARVWQFQQMPDGSIQPVPRGRHRQGLAAGGQVSLGMDTLSPDWQLAREGLTRQFVFDNHRACADFIAALMTAANAANHHPSVHNEDCDVTVTFVTHAAGDTVTEKDYAGAQQADRLAAESLHVLSDPITLFDEAQPRDEHGRFAAVDGGGHTVALHGRDIPVVLPKAARLRGDTLVPVQAAAFDAAFAKEQGFYVGAHGKGGIGTRYDRFGEFAKTAPSIEASEVTIDANGRVGFSNGRHRFAVMRDGDNPTIPVAMSRASRRNGEQHGYVARHLALPSDTVITLPFGDYEDFASCVEANQDKDSPEGFCGWLEHQITGSHPPSIQLTHRDRLRMEMRNREIGIAKHRD